VGKEKKSLEEKRKCHVGGKGRNEHDNCRKGVKARSVQVGGTKKRGGRGHSN